MIVLSLFDGISGGQIAFKNLGIKIDKYFASEIDKSAINITNYNFPNTIQIGDIQNISFKDNKLYKGDEVIFEGKIDMIIGGSPCQDFSSNSKTRKGLDGSKSRLFYEYLRILDEVKPSYFLLENVASMSHSNRDKLTELLNSVRDDVKFYFIKSENFCANIRNRYYWTNLDIDMSKIPNNTETFKDVCNKGVIDDIYIYNQQYIDKALKRIEENHPFKPKIYSINDDRKYQTIIASCGNKSLHSPMIEYNGTYRHITIPELEKLMTLPEGYVSNTQVALGKKFHGIGNGWTIKVIEFIFNHLKLYDKQ